MNKQIIKSRYIFVLFILLLSNNLIYSQWIKTKGPYGGYVYSIVVSGSILLAGTEDGVYRSTNNGKTWQYSGLINNIVRSLIVKDHNIFAGTSGGVFVSNSAGKRWILIHNGIAHLIINDILITGNILLAGIWFWSVALF
jgi:hypothetical protein